MKNSVWFRYSYLWLTLGLFLFSLVGHWLFAWPVYVGEQEMHNAPAEFSDFFMQTSRDTLENWQSEFLQLMLQVAGLAYFLYLGSPQSKESSDREEKKLDLILKAVDPIEAEEKIKALEKKYPKG